MVASEAAQEIGGLIAAVFKNRAMGTIFLWPSRLAMLGLRGIFTFSRSPWHGADRTTDDLLVTDLALLQPMRPDQEIQFLGPELDLVARLAVAPTRPKAAVTVTGRRVIGTVEHGYSRHSCPSALTLIPALRIAARKCDKRDKCDTRNPLFIYTSYTCHTCHTYLVKVGEKTFLISAAEV